MSNAMLLATMDVHTLGCMQKTLQSRVRALPDSPLIADYQEMLAEITAEIDARAQMCARVAAVQS